MYCPDCGWKNADTVSTCEMCGHPLPSRAGRKAAPPPPPVVGAPGVTGPAIAHLGDRMIAVALDTFLMGAAFAVAWAWATSRWGSVNAAGFSLSQKPTLIALATTLLFGFLYTWLFEGAFGATLGKGMAGVEVRMAHGGRCTMGASLVRNVLRIVDAPAAYLVGFLIAIFSKQKQRLGDHIAGTVVVERELRTGSRAVVVALWVAGIAGGAYGAYVLHGAAPAPGTGITIGRVEFLESDGGPPRRPGPFRPGEDVYLRYEITGYARGAQNVTDIAVSTVPYDPAGLALEKPTNVTFRDSVTGDAPVVGRLRFHLPLFVPPGTCKVVIGAEDMLGGKKTERSPALTVEGPATEPAIKLEVRGFAFRTSEDGAPVAPAVFLAEQPVYYSFGIYGVGFRGDTVSLHIEYRLVGPSGEVLVDRPDWQTVDQAFFYHPPTFYLPLNARVSLAPGVPRGRYTQRHIIEDRITGAKLEYKSAFEIR
jgi:uncharacterized RDD family membrane protein YckC